MTANRGEPVRGARRGAPEESEPPKLEERRARMHAAEGHAGSIPRGNQPTEQEGLGQHQGEWERLLGH